MSTTPANSSDVAYSLPDGYTNVPPGKLAAVVTYLEIHEPQAPAAIPELEGFSLERVLAPNPDWYRSLFLRVGSPWLWFGRLRLSDEELIAITHDEAVEVFGLRRGEDWVGLLELDFRQPAEVELAYLGLTADCIGAGAGRFLIQSTIARAAERQVHRLWVHTCTLDHPAALRFYQQAGFIPYGRGIEIFDDPRLIGLLPPDVATHIPRLGS